MNDPVQIAPPARAGNVRDYRPGAFALRDAWFPIEHTPLIKSRAIRRAIHQQPYWLWRENGRIRAAEFPPEDIARSASNATEFTDGTGYYPEVIERYGYAWTWYGNPRNARPELMPDIPYLPRDRKLPSNFWGTIRFDCSYELTCENLLDLTHSDFLHSKLIGDSLSEEDEISVDSTSETVTMVREAKGRRTSSAMRGIVTWSKTQDLRAVTHIHLRSGVTILHGRFDPGISVRLFHPDVPVSPTLTHNNYTFNPRNCNWVARNLFPLMSPIIGGQDNRMLKVQNPRYLREESRPDFSSRFDKAGLTYRRRYQALVERQRAGDFSYQSDVDPGADIAKLMGVEREN